MHTFICFVFFRFLCFEFKIHLRNKTIAPRTICNIVMSISIHVKMKISFQIKKECFKVFYCWFVSTEYYNQVTNPLFFYSGYVLFLFSILFLWVTFFRIIFTQFRFYLNRVAYQMGFKSSKIHVTKKTWIYRYTKWWKD